MGLLIALWIQARRLGIGILYSDAHSDARPLQRLLAKAPVFVLLHKSACIYVLLLCLTTDPILMEGQPSHL